jgi:hypothetical protein
VGQKNAIKQTKIPPMWRDFLVLEQVTGLEHAIDALLMRIFSLWAFNGHFSF